MDKAGIGQLLQKLVAADGLSGVEGPAQAVVQELARPWADELRTDTLGNVIARRRGAANPPGRIMLAAHVDEIGLIVTKVELGFLHVGEVGGVDPRSLIGQEVTVYPTGPGAEKYPNGLPGYIGCRPPHVLSAEDREKVIPLRDLRVDLGGRGAGERENGIAGGQGSGGVGETPPGSVGDRPEHGGSVGDRPEHFAGETPPGSVGDRPEHGGSVGDRPEHGGGSVGDRPEHGGSVGDRPEHGGSVGDRPEHGGSVGDRPERSVVRVGDRVALRGPYIELLGGRVATKALDDRAGVAALLGALGYLADMRHSWDVYAVATVQEEVGLRGAITSAYGVAPDLAIAIDVTFGETPGLKETDTVEMDKGPTIGWGPNLHPGVVKKLREVADALEIPYVNEPIPGRSGTDAWAIQVTREGIPTGLLSIPIRYVHSTTEMVVLADVDRTARLLAAFIGRLDEKFLGGLAEEV
jgi:putative aminopeptidase FrvX